MQLAECVTPQIEKQASRLRSKWTAADEEEEAEESNAINCADADAHFICLNLVCKIGVLSARIT